MSSSVESSPVSPPKKELYEFKEKVKLHPFQDFFYMLREYGISASTSEWLDFQKVLEDGLINNLEDLYHIGRSLLVKNVALYTIYDIVFAELFYGISPDELDDMLDDVIQKEKEDIDEVAEAESLTSEDIHGGKEATKDIEGSPNAANDGIKKKNQKRQRHGSGKKNKDNKKSLKEIIQSGKSKEFDPDKVLSRGQMGRALSRLRDILDESTYVQTEEVDVEATIKKIADNGGIPEVVFKESIEKKPKLILMFDVGGSTDAYRDLMQELFDGARDYFDKVEIYYFHNAIYGYVWPQSDGNRGKNFIPIGHILQSDPDSKVIIVGDAWMADYELPNESIKDFRSIINRFTATVWINPILASEYEEMDQSGTIGDINGIFPMFDLTVNGIEKAVIQLMDV